MLTRLTIRNFKRFGAEVEIELGNPVIFIGPNNSGKTSAMQALALWDIGLKRWNEKRLGKSTPEKRPGVTVNRRDLIAVPAPDANLLWHDLHVRDVRRIEGRQKTSNISRAWRSLIASKLELPTSHRSNAWSGSGGRSRTICAHRKLLKPVQGRRLPTVGARCLRRLKPIGASRQCEKPSWTSRVH